MSDLGEDSTGKGEAMPAYLIAYDLRKKGRNYDALYEAMRQYPHCHALDSTWIISSDKSLKEIGRGIEACLDDNDGLLLCRIQDTAYMGLAKTVREWITRNCQSPL